MLDANSNPVRSPRDWHHTLKAYHATDDSRAAFELLISLIPYLLLVTVMLIAVSSGYWVALILTIPASGFLLRMFAIQHDCGHQSLFTKKWLNDFTGRILGVFTLTPYDYWLHNHALHHASSGNLDRRGVGDIDTLTVDEYQQLGLMKRCLYRLYRHPVTLFLIGPAYMFFVQQRLPVRMMNKGLLPWMSTMGTNAGILAGSYFLIWQFGWAAFLSVIIPTTLLAASLGVWIFFVQHQFEETIWDHTADWDRHEAALFGSSHYDLPPLFRWFSGNIGAHHVHHLNSKIPFFRLNDVLHDYPVLAEVNRITLKQSLALRKLSLWDTKSRRLVSFSDLNTLSA